MIKNLFESIRLFFSKKHHMLISLIILLAVASKGQAASDIEIQLHMSRELSGLPQYCQVRLAEVFFEKEFSGNSRNWPPLFMKSLNHWRGYIGPQNWGYFHHYCFGVRDYNDFMKMSYDNKKRYKNDRMKRALGQFEFMKNAKTSSFPLWYELYRYESLIYTELGDIQKAKQTLQQSLKYRPRK